MGKDGRERRHDARRVRTDGPLPMRAAALPTRTVVPLMRTSVAPLRAEGAQSRAEAMALSRAAGAQSRAEAMAQSRAAGALSRAEAGAPGRHPAAHALAAAAHDRPYDHPALDHPTHDRPAHNQPAATLLGLQRSAGNRAVLGVVQRMPSRAELAAEVGAPKQDKTLLGLRLKKMSTRYKAVLDGLDAYDQALGAPIGQSQAARQAEAVVLGTRLGAITTAARVYLGDHQGAAESRSNRIASLPSEAALEQRSVAGMAGDAAYDNPPAKDWRSEVKRRQFGARLAAARQAKASEGQLRTQFEDVLADDTLTAKQRSAAKGENLANQELVNQKIESSYIDAVGLLVSSPDMIRSMPTRDLLEALIEANRRASLERLEEAAGKVNAVAGLAVLHTRIQDESARQEQAVTAKLTAVGTGLSAGNAVFSDAQLEAMTRPEEDLALLCSVVNNSLTTRRLDVPGWVEWVTYRSGARVQSLLRTYRRVSPLARLDQLPRALTAPYSLLGPTNPLADWVKPVFREDARNTGEATAALAKARAGAANRADADYNAALDRLRDELGVDPSQVEDVLKRSLLVLAKAPLTVNLNRKKVLLVLASGGFKNYWQVNPALARPAPTAGPDEQQKYSYQEERLDIEHRLFGGTNDLTTKMQRGPEQPISTGANVASYQLGSAPSRDYGQSVAFLRDSVKQRATYTPWDALELMKRINGGQALVGPEVVATHDNLAAIIRYTATGTLKDIVKKAQDPTARFDNATAAYIEAQIHGPLSVGDIERITIALEEVEDEAYDILAAAGTPRPNAQQVATTVAQVRTAMETQIKAAGVDVTFASL